MINNYHKTLSSDRQLCFQCPFYKFISPDSNIKAQQDCVSISSHAVVLIGHWSDLPNLWSLCAVLIESEELSVLGKLFR